MSDRARVRRCAAILIASSLQWPGAGRAEPAPGEGGASRTATTAGDPRVRIRAEEEDGLDLGRLVLDLPAHLLELAFVPLLPLIVLDERYAIGKRLYDLFTNDDRTLALVPFVTPLDSSGLGFGAALIHQPHEVGVRTVVIGLAHLNGDYRIFGDVSHALDRTHLSLLVHGESQLDSDRRYYGTGRGTTQSAKHLFSYEAADAAAGVQWVEPRRGELSLGLSAGINRSLTEPTDAHGAPSVRPHGELEPPPGFGQQLAYGQGLLDAGFATRDANGRLHRGLELYGHVQVASAIDAHPELSGIQGRLEVIGHIPIFGHERMLVLAARGTWAAPLGAGREVPFFLYTFYGGPDALRGYPSYRFAGLFSWWSTAEYRYPIYHVPSTDLRWSAAWFGEVGQLGDHAGDLARGPLPFSFGAGLTLESIDAVLARFQIAGSPEGVQLTAAIGGLR